MLKFRFENDFFSNEDDVTVKLTEIVFTNSIIKQGLAKGTNTQALMVGSIVHIAYSLWLILSVPGTMGNLAISCCHVC
jgi:DNA-directed RNA polymerase III subunit RPC1